MKKTVLKIKLCTIALVLGIWTSASAQIVEVQSISCPGSKDGQLFINTTTSTPDPNSYTWVNLGTGATVSTENSAKGLGAGDYQVTVTDGVTTSIFSYSLNDPAPIINTFPATVANSQWPTNNGSFTISTTGGSGVISYTITDSISRKVYTQTANSISNLASGTYFITTKDTHGCKRNDIVRVPELAPYGEIGTNNSGILKPDTTACYKDVAATAVKPDTVGAAYPVVVLVDGALFKTVLGFKSGTDTVNMHLGTAGTIAKLGLKPSQLYITQLSTVATGPNAGKDTITTSSASVSNTYHPGFHIVEVYTADGKGFRYSWDVDSVVAPVSITYTQTNNLCFGDKKATFTATVRGSYEEFTNKYTISVSVPAGATAIPSSTKANKITGSNLIAGSYTVNATDWAGCPGSQTITITSPDEPLRINFRVDQEAKCPYSSDGAVSIFRVDGSKAPVTYSWDNGGTTQTAEFLPPGVHKVTITDANNCTVTDSITLASTRKSCFYNIVTPNGDGYNDYFDLTDMCYGVQMEAKIFNESGQLVATLTEANPKWDAVDPSTPPTGPASTYTAFIKLSKNGKEIAKLAESFSVIYSK